MEQRISSIFKGISGQVFFPEDEWHPATGVWDCPPGNVSNLEINLVQSGATDFVMDVPTCLFR